MTLIEELMATVKAQQHTIEVLTIKLEETNVYWQIEALKKDTDKQANRKEDEYDLAVYENAYAEYLSSGKQSAPIGDLWKELNL